MKLDDLNNQGEYIVKITDFLNGTVEYYIGDASIRRPPKYVALRFDRREATVFNDLAAAEKCAKLLKRSYDIEFSESSYQCKVIRK